jgi:hypothetical protein
MWLPETMRSGSSPAINFYLRVAIILKLILRSGEQVEINHESTKRRNRIKIFVLFVFRVFVIKNKGAKISSS